MYELKDNELVFAKVKPNAIIPTKRDEDAGYDIYACFEEDFMVIPANETKLVPTGIASAMTDKWYLQVEERGSTGVKGIKKSAGVIDSGFRNEIFIAITNANSNDMVISKLSKEKLIKRYGKKDEFEDIVLDYGDKKQMIYLVDTDESDFYNMSAIIYPYSKAIAQLVVHEVPKMEVNEISYEELLAIPSTRGVSMLGGSGK